MRLIAWILTVAFALAGLALRAEGAYWFAPYSYLSVYFWKGCFLIAFLACPFVWARSYGIAPRGLQVPGKERFMMALALILAIPLIVPWH